MQTVSKIILQYKILVFVILGTILITGVAVARVNLSKITASSSSKSTSDQTKPGTASSSPSNSTGSSSSSNSNSSSTSKSTATTPKTPATSSSPAAGSPASNPAASPAPTTPTPAAPATPTTYCGTYPSVPNSACTGWQHTGVSLRSVPEQVTSGAGWSWEGAPFNYVKITDNAAVLDSLDIHGCIYVDNSVGIQTATIKRSRVTGSCDYLVRLGDYGTSVDLRLQDVELVGGAVQMKGDGFSWTRVNSYGFTGKAAMMGTNTVVRDSYIHDNVCNPPDHQSGIGTNGGATNIQMIHNNVDLLPGDCTSGGIANYDDFGAFSNILIQNNLINSAGYCLKAGFEQGAASGNTMRVIDNTFGRKYYPECGYWGAVSNWLNGSGNVWSGNVWGDGAAATSAHALGSPVLP